MIALCTTCKGREQHLKQTLPKNLADNADYPDCKFIVLDYGSPGDVLEYLRTQHAGAIAAGRLVVYSFPYAAGEPFHMAHAKNMAHRCGMREGADILVNLDADNYTGPGFAAWIASQFQQPNIFTWAGLIRGQGRRLRGTSGRIAVTARAFLLAGGYDEKYDTWGPDDKDFNARLQTLGFSAVETPRLYLESVVHTDGLRFKEYPHARQEAGESGDLPVEPCSPIANWGWFGCGRVYRNFCEEWTDIDPVATRIFGIGLHKTATTSLHHALQILGFDSAHWESGAWARTIWEEMHAAGHSLAVEKRYALSDLPIPLLYKALDRAYPGSQFILTVRSEESWLRSVRDHWSYERNPLRYEWDIYPFTNRIHRAIYGQTHYDALVFLARYRRHNQEVQEYFANRPDDLLVMDMEEGAGWQELCTFLGAPEPSVPYPTAYQTQHQRQRWRARRKANR
jgi:hypothetical protein